MSINRDQIDNESRSSLHNLRGIDLAERGWLDEAINEFKHAIKNAPNSAHSYDNLASVYADKGELLDALTSYVKAIELEPESPIALHNLGCFLSNHGNRLAARCFKNAFTVDPELYEARFNYGLCFAAEEKHEQAVAQFEKALHLNDDNETRFYLALSLIALEKHAAAIKELLKVVRSDKDNDQAWFHLGTSYQEQGFLDEAVNALTKAIIVNPQHTEAVLALASLLKRLDRDKEAKSLVKRAHSLDQKRTEEFVAHDEYLCHDASLYFVRHK
jgi:tetratricopeptide (TPR) repeat protein